jgi:hypothetical protein
MCPFLPTRRSEPVHGVSLMQLNAYAQKTVFNMIVEVPRWTNAKLEV